MSAFNPSAAPISLNNLVFERAALLFNLAALYSQLATTEDRSSITGIKRAASSYQVYSPLCLIHSYLCFQYAAGTLFFLYSSVLPEFVESCHADESPIELSKDFVKGLECLMLAQAQECSWQLAKLSMLNPVFWLFCLHSLRPIQEFSNREDCCGGNKFFFFPDIISLNVRHRGFIGLQRTPFGTRSPLLPPPFHMCVTILVCLIAF